MPKRKIQKCGNCNNDSDNPSFPVSYDFVRDGWFCPNCYWNDAEETRRVTKDQYQYWFRLTRLFYRAQRSHPYPRQARDIVTRIVSHSYAREVPFWAQNHLARAHMPYLGAPRWYFTPFCKSRWEYHSMLEDGYISSWAEYQQLYKERREWEAENLSDPDPDYEPSWYQDYD